MKYSSLLDEPSETDLDTSEASASIWQESRVTHSPQAIKVLSLVQSKLSIDLTTSSVKLSHIRERSEKVLLGSHKVKYWVQRIIFLMCWRYSGYDTTSLHTRWDCYHHEPVKRRYALRNSSAHKPTAHLSYGYNLWQLPWTG